jgi:hypothetical protein
LKGNYGSKFVVLGYNFTYFSNKIQKDNEILLITQKISDTKQKIAIADNQIIQQIMIKLQSWQCFSMAFQSET